MALDKNGIAKRIAKEIKEGDEFGSMIEAKKEIAPGDILEAFIITKE